MPALAEIDVDTIILVLWAVIIFFGFIWNVVTKIARALKGADPLADATAQKPPAPLAAAERARARARIAEAERRQAEEARRRALVAAAAADDDDDGDDDDVELVDADADDARAAALARAAAESDRARAARQAAEDRRVQLEAVLRSARRALAPERAAPARVAPPPPPAAPPAPSPVFEAPRIGRPLATTGDVLPAEIAERLTEAQRLLVGSEVFGRPRLFAPPRRASRRA